MKKIKKEKVLKYLSGEMTDMEKSRFFSELKKDKELTDILETEENKFAIFDKFTPDISEDYFINLLPRTRAKIDKKRNKKRKKYDFVKYAFPAVMVLAIGLNFIKLDKNSFFDSSFIFADSTNYDLLIESDQYYLDDLIEEDLISSASFLQLDEEANKINIVYQNSGNSFLDIFDKHSYLSELKDFSISTEEMKTILKNINSKETL